MKAAESKMNELKSAYDLLKRQKRIQEESSLSIAKRQLKSVQDKLRRERLAGKMLKWELDAWETKLVEARRNYDEVKKSAASLNAEPNLRRKAAEQIEKDGERKKQKLEPVSPTSRTALKFTFRQPGSARSAATDAESPSFARSSHSSRPTSATTSGLMADMVSPTLDSSTLW